MSVMQYMISAFPLLMAGLVVLAGLVLLVRGVRGEADLSFPSCAKCGYDLRNRDLTAIPACPECGTPLNEPHAVLFGRYRRRPRLALLGFLMIVLPIVLLVGLVYMFTIRAQQSMQASMGPAVMPMTLSWSTQSTDQLVQALAVSPDDSSIWQEFFARYESGALNDEEIAAIFDRLIICFQNRVGQMNIRYGPGNEFMHSVVNDNRIDPEQLARLAEAYYSREPRPRLRSRVRSTAPFTLFMERSPATDLAGLTTICSLSKVSLDDGTPLEVRNPWYPGEPVTAKTGQQMAGQLTINREPGTYTLKMCVNTWVMRAPLDRSAWKNGETPPAIAQWSTTVSLEVPVLPAIETQIDILRNDSMLREKIRDHIRPIQLQITRDEAKTSGKLWITFADAMPVPLSMDVWVRYGQREVRLGYFSTSQPSENRSKFSAALPDFSEAIERVTVILKPNFPAVDRMVDTKEVWGEPMEFSDVPVAEE